jgi:hypothetical protein
MKEAGFAMPPKNAKQILSTVSGFVSSEQRLAAFLSMLSNLLKLLLGYAVGRLQTD